MLKLLTKKIDINPLFGIIPLLEIVESHVRTFTIFKDFYERKGR